MSQLGSKAWKRAKQPNTWGVSRKGEWLGYKKNKTKTYDSRDEITTYEQFLVNEDVSLSNTTLLRGVSIASLMNNTLISIEGMHNK